MVWTGLLLQRSIAAFPAFDFYTVIPRHLCSKEWAGKGREIGRLPVWRLGEYRSGPTRGLMRPFITTLKCASDTFRLPPPTLATHTLR